MYCDYLRTIYENRVNKNHKDYVKRCRKAIKTIWWSVSYGFSWYERQSYIWFRRAGGQQIVIDMNMVQ
ncbi:MAG: hypothetical protein CM15mV25_1840 [uncultured marine virus]|nr:MAG: hypothetical protein CM15mV25_1840 [uncultured marine virus]